MDYDSLRQLKQHPTWRLLNADWAPFILSFFHHAFIQPGVRAYSQPDLVAKLEDYLFHVRQLAGEEAYPRSAQEYLDDWARGENAYLRKYYPDVGDEPEYDLTPASEKAIEWLRGLEPKAFVGTESRLLMIFQLLREIIQSTEMDPAVRIAELEKQKQQLDAEIARLREGLMDPYDPTRIKERYQEIEDTARRLLADFRQVEENFRQLDRRTRERIATSQDGKGALLDEIFGEQDVIAQSDQGRSFRAFWAFLMSRERQAELQNLVAKLMALSEVQNLQPEDILPRMKYRLMEAGDKVKKTTATLVEHLRRFLDDQVWIENKRILNLIRSVETRAVEIRDQTPVESAFAWLDEVRAAIDLPMARGLLVPTKGALIQDSLALEGEADFESDALYALHYVDEEVLKAQIRRILQDHSQATLAQICERFPIEKGLSELLTYLHIATKEDRTTVDEGADQAISWRDSHGSIKKAMMPRIIFTR